MAHGERRSAALIVVRGTVQGVWFRASTAEVARGLGLDGWVRNRPDGSVEIAASGDREALDRLIAWCRVGPPGARVDAVQTTWVEPDNQTGFVVRR